MSKKCAKIKPMNQAPPRGRPKTHQEPIKRLNIYLPQSIFDKLKALAKNSIIPRSLSAKITELIAEK